jgi:hypothetical protein
MTASASSLPTERNLRHGEAERLHQQRDRGLHAVLAPRRGAPRPMPSMHTTASTVMGSAIHVTWLGMTTVRTTRLSDPSPDEVPPGPQGHNTAACARRHRGASGRRQPPAHPRTCESRGDHGVPSPGAPSTKIDNSRSAACSAPMPLVNAPVGALRASSCAPKTSSATRSSSAVWSHR